jgi:hypothetical protein
MMEERKNLLLNMNSEVGINNNPENQRRDERIEAMQFHIDTLRTALLTMDADD